MCGCNNRCNQCNTCRGGCGCANTAAAEETNRCGCGSNRQSLQQAYCRGYAVGFQEGLRACRCNGIMPLAAENGCGNNQSCGCTNNNSSC